MHGVSEKMLALTFIFLALSGSGSLQPSENTLFTETSPLEIEMHFDFRDLCRSKNRSDCSDAEATLRIMDPDDPVQAIPVRLRTRGSWRLHEIRCKFPPLFVIFEDSGPEGAPFAGQTILPLTTHCFSNDRHFRRYVLMEYLAYRFYNAITAKSIRARLARVVYVDARNGRATGPNFAFFTEHFRSVAERNGATVFEDGWQDAKQFDPAEMTLLAVFEFMIGNTDWSVLAGHNITYLQGPDGRLSPLPFDFDFSGLVDAKYATPPPRLPIRTVRQRLYRGFCYPELDWESLYGRFVQAKPAIDESLDEVDSLSSVAAKQAKRYLNSFYKILQSPDKSQRWIADACRPL